MPKKVYAATRRAKKSTALTYAKAARARRASDRVFVPRMLFSVEAPKTFRIARHDAGLFSSSGGGIVNQAVHVLDPSGCTEWASLSALYDQYKVLECWVKVFPAYNSITEAVSTTGGYAPVIFVYDPDDTAAVASIDIGLHYGNHQMFNVYRPLKYGVRPIIQGDNSVNNAGMALSYRPGYGNLLDVAQVANYQKGVITWYGANLPPSAKVGEVVVEYYVQFFNRR